MEPPTSAEIDEEFDLSRETLSDAEAALVEERLRTAVSRAYYAIFHAARAVLWSRGLVPKTHKGLLQLFRQHLVQTGLADKQLGEVLHAAFEDRELADYHAASGSFDRAEVERLIRDAQDFLTRMETLLKGSAPTPDVPRKRRAA